jgi:hypothetical protein
MTEPYYNPSGIRLYWSNGTSGLNKRWKKDLKFLSQEIHGSRASW